MGDKHRRRRLSGGDRQTLRKLIDSERRRRISWQAEPRCVRCGIELIDADSGEYRYAAGCLTCSDRRSKHGHRSRLSALRGLGWRPIVSDLHEKLLTLDPKYRLFQVKEKFGQLRYYASFDESVAEEGARLIACATAEAAATCEVCAAAALLRKRPALKTLCDTCWPSFQVAISARRAAFSEPTNAYPEDFKDFTRGWARLSGTSVRDPFSHKGFRSTNRPAIPVRDSPLV